MWDSQLMKYDFFLIEERIPEPRVLSGLLVYLLVDLPLFIRTVVWRSYHDCLNTYFVFFSMNVYKYVCLSYFISKIKHYCSQKSQMMMFNSCHTLHLQNNIFSILQHNFQHIKKNCQTQSSLWRVETIL